MMSFVIAYSYCSSTWILSLRRIATQLSLWHLPWSEEANHYTRIANWLQIIIIVGSVLVTSATSAAGFGLIGDIVRWVAPTISIVVAASAGLTGYFKFKERSFNLQRTADAIEQEYKTVILRRGYYKGKPSDEALELFTDRVESLNRRTDIASTTIGTAIRYETAIYPRIKFIKERYAIL